MRRTSAVHQHTNCDDDDNVVVVVVKLLLHVRPSSDIHLSLSLHSVFHWCFVEARGEMHRTSPALIRWRSPASLLHSAGLGAPNRWLLMRFDGPSRTTHDENDGGAPPQQPRLAELPETMQAKEVSPSFTPFPLPMYDEAMGFGPTRLRNIPDVELAAQRVEQRRTTTTSTTMFADESGMDEAAAFLATMEDDDAVPHSSLHDALDQAEPATSSGAAAKEAANDDNAADDWFGGYVADERFPIVDRLTCRRTVTELLHQFLQRPERIARTATILDLASTLQQRSNAEVEVVLYELSQLFSPHGNGLRFLTTQVVKFGRPYSVSSELTSAFISLVEALTEMLVEAQPQRLAESPAMLVQLLHFLALIKVFQPNKWYEMNANSPQNRADYSHPQGINRNTAYQRVGEDLFDAVAESLLRPGGLQGFSLMELVGTLGGLIGVVERPDGALTTALVEAILQRWASENNSAKVEENTAVMEQLYFLLAMTETTEYNDVLLARLMDAEGGNVRLPKILPTRGPSFFAAAGRDAREEVRRAATQMLEEAITTAKSAKDEELVAALVDAGHGLLLSRRAKDEAVSVAQRLHLNALSLQHMPAMKTVADRLHAEEEERHAHASSSSSSPHGHQHTYLVEHEGRLFHPIRTFTSSLEYLRSLNNMYLLHSSVVGNSISSLTSCVQRLQTGKDGLVVSYSCLRELSALSYTAEAENTRMLAKRALRILAEQLAKGRVVLLSYAEEVELHDAGTYCNEDLILWTVAAYCAREMPLLKVHTLMSSTSIARNPHHFLKGEHSPLTRSTDLYDPSLPLLRALRSKELRSITHHTRLQKPIRKIAS